MYMILGACEGGASACGPDGHALIKRVLARRSRERNLLMAGLRFKVIAQDTYFELSL
jgi:hypothetical protein